MPALLDTPHSGWRMVSLNKKAIKVGRVQQGSEAQLCHFLESAVLQAKRSTLPNKLSSNASGVSPIWVMVAFL